MGLGMGPRARRSPTFCRVWVARASGGWRWKPAVGRGVDRGGARDGQLGKIWGRKRSVGVWMGRRCRQPVARPCE